MEGGLYHYEVELGGRTFRQTVPIAEIYALLSRNEKQIKNFPTSYSSTDKEEHFCDALAMFVLGTLPEEHATPFKAIWG
jgi:hypothetical protein